MARVSRKKQNLPTPAVDTPIRRWKTGYHLIAKETGVDVFLAHADYRTKEVGYGKKFALGDDAREDTNRIQLKYKEMNLTGLRPEGFVTE